MTKRVSVLVILLLSPASAVTALAQTQIQTAPTAWWIPALTIGVPIFVAVMTLAGSIWGTRNQLVAQFAAKAAELALMGEGPPEIINRSRLIAELYGNLLPKDFKRNLQNLKEKDIGRIVTKAPWPSEFMKDVVEVLAKHPIERRDQIIKDYISVFPYKELKALQTDISPPAPDNPAHDRSLQQQAPGGTASRSVAVDGARSAPRETNLR